MYTSKQITRFLNLDRYFLLCSFVSSAVAIYFFKTIETESFFFNYFVSVLTGTLSGAFLCFPLSRSCKQIVSALKSFKNNKQSFNQKTKFPIELAELSEELKNLCDLTQSSSIELMRQDNSRRELVANAAHDIKGPLTSVLGYLEDSLSRLESGNLETARQSLEVCLKNTRHLERIVLEVFEAAKFDNLIGNLAIEVAAVDELLSDIAQKFQVRLGRESKKLIFKLEANNSLIQVDLGLFERAISNLLDNAIKYTEAEGFITLGSKIDSGLLIIYVSDTGKGIPEKDLPHIFDRLYRVERDRSKEAKGSGFGLSIVKKIIEAHSGQIICSSTLGAGSVFQITLSLLSKNKIAEAMAEMISKRN